MEGGEILYIRSRTEEATGSSHSVTSRRGLKRFYDTWAAKIKLLVDLSVMCGRITSDKGHNNDMPIDRLMV